jgi:hypothetical protein
MSWWREDLEVGTATGADLAQALENRETGFGEYLGAQTGLGFADTSTNMLAEAYRAGPMAPFSAEGAPNPAYEAEGIPTEGGARGLSQDEFKSLAGDRPIPFNPFLTRGRAQGLIEAHDLQRWREWQVQRRHAGAFVGTLGFAAGMAGSMPDPINFVPLGGAGWAAARGAKQLTRMAMIGRHAAVGFGEAALGTAALEPAIMERHRSIGDDMSFTEAALDIVMGGLLGGAVGGGAGWWHSRGLVPDGHPGLMPPAQDIERAGELVDLAVGDVIAGRPVAVAGPLDRFRDNLLGTAAAARGAPGAEGPPRSALYTMPAEMWLDRTVREIEQTHGFAPTDARVEALVHAALRDELGKVLDAAGLAEDAFAISPRNLPGRAAAGAGERAGQPAAGEPGAAGRAGEAAGVERAAVAERAAGAGAAARAAAGDPGALGATRAELAGGGIGGEPGALGRAGGGAEAVRPAEGPAVLARTPGEGQGPAVQRGRPAEALSVHEQIRRFVAGEVEASRAPRPLSDASPGRPEPDPAAEVKAELERPEPEPLGENGEFDELLDYEAALADGRVAPQEKAAVEAATAELERLAKIEKAHDQAALCVLGGLG